MVTTLNMSDEAIAPRREGGWDESFAIASIYNTFSIVKPMSIIIPCLGLNSNTGGDLPGGPARHLRNSRQFFDTTVLNAWMHVLN